MKKPFFDTTRESLEAITSLYDFLWPTATALWNLRWQVAGYCSAHPSAGVRELRARFIEGSGIHGANLQRACIETPWNDQTAILGGILLTNLFAIYEGWSARIVRAVGKPESAAKRLQQRGVTEAVAEFRSSTSPLLESSVYPVMTARRVYDLGHLDNYVLAYRYFKAIRNKQLHNHGVADEACEDAYRDFEPVANEVGLGHGVVPEYCSVVEGEPVSVTLRGVVGFSDIVRRMLYTIDAELARSRSAELTLDELWWRHRRKPGVFKSDQTARWHQIVRTFQRMGFGGVKLTKEIERELVARGLVVFVPK